MQILPAEEYTTSKRNGCVKLRQEESGLGSEEPISVPTLLQDAAAAYPEVRKWDPQHFLKTESKVEKEGSEEIVYFDLELQRTSLACKRVVQNKVFKSKMIKDKCAQHEIPPFQANLKMTQTENIKKSQWICLHFENSEKI